MELFLWTIYGVGVCSGALIVLIAVIIRMKRVEQIESEKAKSYMSCYRADVAMGCIADRNESDRQITELRNRNNQLLGINHNLCKAIEAVRR